MVRKLVKIRSTGMQSNDQNNTRPFGLGPHVIQIFSAAIGISALIAFTLFLFTGPWKTLVLHEDARDVSGICLYCIIFFWQEAEQIIASANAA